MKVVLIDDEKAALRGLERLILEAYDSITIIGKFTNIESSLETIINGKPDVVFLDIEMSMVNGIEGAVIIKNILPETNIIFTTAYEQYAIKAFEIDARDYLLKPILKERLIKAIDKIMPKTENIIQEFLSNKNRIYTFNSFRIVINNYEEKFRTRKAKELLAFLIHFKKPIHRDKIIDTLWKQDKGYYEAINIFNVTMSYLRKTLKLHNMEGIIQSNNNLYTLDSSAFHIDHIFFNNLSSYKIDSNSIHNIEKGIELYSGGYLEQEYYEWSNEAKKFYENGYKQILSKISEFYFSLRIYDKASQYNLKLLQVDFLDEKAICNRMRIFNELGDKKAIVDLYNNYEKSLYNNFGVLPKRNTIDLYSKLSGD